jgi:hypothetical protein
MILPLSASLLWLQVRKLRSDYGLLKQRPKLFLAVSNAERASVLERSTAEVGQRASLCG